MRRSSTVEMRTSDVAAATGGRLVGPDATVSGAAIDSRLVSGGELFVPVVAERDGHDFVPAALSAGAAAYLTARGALPDAAGATAVEVDDTSSALSALGAHGRQLLQPGVDGRVVGVTGSVGKTSVKDLLAAALSARWRTTASAGSFNNELGVPLTLLGAPGDTQALVVEMGARGAGHVAALCAVARPSVGVVTRVAAVHTETFGTIDDVATAKSELVAALPASGVAVLNAADPRVAAMARRTAARVVMFGEGGDVRAEDVTLDDELRATFRLASPWGSGDVRLGARGLHMVDNALAAAAAALVCDVALDDVVAALGQAGVSRWRMELATLPSGARLLNDAYNANPVSMAAALRALAGLPARRRVAVLGLMAEIGPSSESEHRAVGDLARDLGVEVVALGVPEYGGTPVADLADAVAALGDLGPDDAVLLKGSRVAGLERLVDLLR
ncbi:MAG TPA: UDP-N-acetylmuramoyl-tripeptide--D-alanyl-D-alanine ligase [Acidimicrobiales bacterium]|nr:UDP-N-acetylmuramoyl-tripeptide--D-alanyl-D-alanine ligase [Acidimicrobiales bacterium]